MTRFSAARWAGLFLVGGLAMQATAHAAQLLPQPEFAEGAGVVLKFRSFYDTIPPCGFLPVRVTVLNAAPERRAWKILAEHTQAPSSQVHFTTEITVDGSQEATVDLLVPLVASTGASAGFSSLNLRVVGPGAVDATSTMTSPGLSGTPTPYLGMGETLSVANWGPLGEAVKNDGKRALAGTALQMDLLPDDWRGLAGFEVIVLTAAEWRSLAAGRRAALDDWILAGGRLILTYEGDQVPGDLPAGGSRGYGTVERWGDDELLIHRLSAYLKTVPASVAEVAASWYSWKWEPVQSIGRPEPPKTLILVFVIVFAVLIGPVNFLTFAPPGARHRLFWTTPVLSVAASLLLAGFILLSEGFGGQGRRFLAVLLTGERHQAVLWQEQAARTGVLLGTTFQAADTFLLPLALGATPTSRPWSAAPRNYSLTQGVWGGDWFRSRRTQAQALVSVTPTRSRLDVQTDPSGTPFAVSSFDHELGEIWYFDADGVSWHAGSTAPGARTRFTRVEAPQFDAWLERMLRPAGDLIRKRVEGIAKSGRRATYFASVPDPSALATLPSIRWKDSEGLVIGRIQP